APERCAAAPGPARRPGRCPRSGPPRAGAPAPPARTASALTGERGAHDGSCPIAETDTRQGAGPPHGRAARVLAGGRRLLVLPTITSRCRAGRPLGVPRDPPRSLSRCRLLQ